MVYYLFKDKKPVEVPDSEIRAYETATGEKLLFKKAQEMARAGGASHRSRPDEICAAIVAGIRKAEAEAADR